MTISALNPPDAGDPDHELLLEFPDNRLLIDLCGEFDKHLAQLEQILGIQILRRGNQLAIIGEARAEGARVLNALYGRLESGREVTPADIDAEIRMRGSDKDTGARDGDQIEMFKGGHVEIKTRKKTIEPRTQAQKDYVTALYKNELGFGIGPAGTGKTYLAVAVGVSMFLTGKVDRIILSRPAVEAGERLGFLPGKQAAKLIEEKRIEIAPLAFMRGRTLSNAFVVLDEAQNATTMQMKMFLTRLGEGSRMVITGDRSQVDLPRGVKSGLRDAEDLIKGVKGVSFSYFTSKDVVRHPLVARIIEAYEAAEVNSKS